MGSGQWAVGSGQWAVGKEFSICNLLITEQQTINTKQQTPNNLSIH
jgi:hypothetical protein